MTLKYESRSHYYKIKSKHSVTNKQSDLLREERFLYCPERY